MKISQIFVKQLNAFTSLVQVHLKEKVHVCKSIHNMYKHEKEIKLGKTMKTMKMCVLLYQIHVISIK